MAARPVFVLGSINMDLVTVTTRVPGPGETIASESFSTGFGGKGANQAVAAARLLSPDQQQTEPGLVRMIGAVGDDQFGKDFLAHLSREGIDTSAVDVKQGQRTGCSVIIVEKATGENRILFSAGANGDIKPADIHFPKLDSQEKPGLVILQHEIPLDVVLHGLSEAKKNGLETVLNPAPAIKLPEEAYKNITHLILNESEASLLSGVPEEELVSKVADVAKVFIERGVETAVITLGSKGAFFATRDSIASGGQQIPAHKVKVVDTTAAGDTFVGAYAIYLSQHGPHEIAAAIEFGNKAASLTVQKSGAQSSIPTLEEMSQVAT